MSGCAKIIIKHLRGYKNIEYDVWNETGEKGTGCIREINKGETTDMYLKKFQMKNFRKYREESNTIMFVNSDGVRRKPERQRKAVPKRKQRKIRMLRKTMRCVEKRSKGKRRIVKVNHQ